MENFSIFINSGYECVSLDWRWLLVLFLITVFLSYFHSSIMAYSSSNLLFNCLLLSEKYFSLNFCLLLIKLASNRVFVLQFCCKFGNFEVSASPWLPNFVQIFSFLLLIFQKIFFGIREIERIFIVFFLKRKYSILVLYSHFYDLDEIWTFWVLFSCYF